MAATQEKTYTEYFAELKQASGPDAMQQLVLGSVYADKDALNAAHEALLAEAEEAGDNRDYLPAADAFRKDSVMAWTLDDNRMIENVSTQALYYGALTDFGTLIRNYSSVWAMWAHMLPKLKPRDRARLGDFARFRRSFELGLREREADDRRISAAVSLLAPTFDALGALNIKAINDKNADVTEATGQLWEDTARLLQEIEKSAAS